MLFVHENNIQNKIRTNYNHIGNEIETFYSNEYLPMKEALLAIDFNEDNFEAFENATRIINNYANRLKAFSLRKNIKSQSKFESTFLEEISVYLFHNIPQIRNNTFGIFNKKIYAGLKIDSNNNVAVITKDVDFCIGKKSNISIDGGNTIELILPIVAVEVKTYLDATMFGEIKSSSKSIRSASPNSKAYVLMGYKDLKDDHIIAARQDSTLTEMFALKENGDSPIDANVLFEYWKEIVSAINSIAMEDVITVPGKLLNP